MKGPAKARKALGRGLGALIPEPPEPRPAPASGEALVMLDIDLLAPNPMQPRQDFDDAALRELAASIAEQGVITPIVARPSGERFEIVAGERRWRAAQLAGLTRIPAVVRNYQREKALEVALVENIQRADLNAIEEAQAFRVLIDEFQLKHEDVARRVGKDRASVTNALRLLKLSPALQGLVRERKLSAAHARALLSVADERARAKLAARVVDLGLSVRATEKLVDGADRAKGKAAAPPPPPDVFVRNAQEKLQHALGTKVRIEKAAKGGKITIEFYSDEELMRLFDRLVK